MQISDTFASTVAVTIPVLLLAATVELGSLADVVTRQTIEWQEESFLRAITNMKLLTQIRKQTSRVKISSFIRIIYSTMIPMPMSLSSVWLPLAWLIAIILAAISEVFNLLHLAGVHNDSGPALLSIIAIMILILMLIVTPAIRTFVIAPRMGIHQYLEKAKNLDLDVHMLETVLEEIPVLVEINTITAERGKEMTEKIRSRLAKTSSTKGIDTNHQRRWRPYAQAGLRSSPRRPPRWVAQGLTVRGGSPYRDSSRKQ